MILTVEEDVSRAIVECSQNTWHDEGVISPKAARTVRRFPFTEEETFEGKLSKRQKASLPLPLLNLVSLILDGETTTENASTNAETVTTNLAQLLRFNAVKTKRICDGFLRHSKFNEPTLPVKIGLLVHAKTRKKSLVEKLAAEGLSIIHQRVQDIQKISYVTSSKRWYRLSTVSPKIVLPKHSNWHRCFLAICEISKNSLYFS